MMREKIESLASIEWFGMLFWVTFLVIAFMILNNIDNKQKANEAVIDFYDDKVILELESGDERFGWNRKVTFSGGEVVFVNVTCDKTGCEVIEIDKISD